MDNKIILSIYNAKEALYYLNKELEKRTQILWTTKSGEQIEIDKMTDKHLINTINLLEQQSELDDIQGDYLSYGN